MSQSKKIIYVSYTYDKEHEELQHTIEEMFNEVVELPVEKRDYELPKKDNITMRLHSWRKVGDYYAGSLVMYTDGSMTTGEKESSSLEKFELPEGKKIVQVTLFLYFPSTKIFSVLYNHHGARYSAIMNYLNFMQFKLGYDPIVYLKPKLILYPDVQQLLSDKSLSLATVSISRDKIPTTQDKSSLFSAFTQLRSYVSDESVIEITVKKRPRSRSDDDILRNQSIFNLLGSDSIEELRCMYEKVSAKFGEELVNILQEKYESSIQTKDYNDPGTHESVQEEMYHNYQTNRELLTKAVSSEAD